MKLHQSLLLAILAATALPFPNAQAQPVTQWVHVLPGAIHSATKCIQPTPDGNLILAMEFSNTMDFDPGPLVQNFSPIGPGGNDLFIGKYDTLGHLIWGKVIGGGGVIYANHLHVSNLGIIHLLGNYGGIFDFDPGPGTFNLSSANNSPNSDYFMLRLDGSGNFLQAHGFGRNGYESDKGVVTDASGNTYYCGEWQYSTDLDPGPGTLPYGGAGPYCGFLIKVDLLGNLVWADVWIAAATNFYLPHDVALGPSGDVYLAGRLNGTADVDPGPAVQTMSAIGASDMMMMRLDPTTGAMKLAVRGEGSGRATATRIAVNSHEEIYMAGEYDGAIDLDPGLGVASHVSPAASSATTFFTSWDSSGLYRWSAAFVDPNALPFGLAVDAADNMLATGYFSGITDFDPGPGVYNLSSTNSIYYYSLDRQGNLRWAMNTGSQSSNGHDICATPDGSVYAAFVVWDDADYDPGPGQYNVVMATGAVSYAGFLRLKECLPRHTSLAASICSGQVHPFAGQNLSQPGTYTDTLSTTGGCDSIITLSLSLTPAAQGSDTVDACGSYSWGGTLLNATGIYTDTLRTLQECDSIVTLHLTLHSLSATATLSGGTLQASPANALGYQWFLCGNPNLPILNATSPSFTPIATGSYAVQVTDSFCTATSPCVAVEVTGIQHDMPGAHLLHPNPSAAHHTLSLPARRLPARLTLLSISGQELWQGDATDPVTVLHVSAKLPAGAYLLRIISEDAPPLTLRLLKQ